MLLFVCFHESIRGDDACRRGEFMAIEYVLYMTTELLPQQAVGLLASRFDDKVVDDRFWSRPEILISAASFSPEIIAESFGFLPTLSVGFRRPNEGDIYR